MKFIKNHEHYEMLISRYKDKDLNYNEILEMNKHLETCESCKKFMSDIDSISSILTGNKSIKIEKAKRRIYPYIISMAAALLIFVGVAVILNNNSNNNELIVSNNIDAQYISEDFDRNGYGDYIPLSTYFNEEEELTNNDEMIILSSYMYYVGQD
ncbi:zf-HC2 domain-containing protein [Brachyspira catarrhinii]|uniref:Zf-HC2 domain-containing protein n=1 Tax=Brachyspira catarrhinii TaxID=2528966 RepID=A0ABY2TSJ7_9SPIR|nr:zf-HC2 domain-containing protein [Brachyspira catarrhinii]TKZ35548.1 zf-HC2 domain-containing protein [Brachyspira catarrhinii]